MPSKSFDNLSTRWLLFLSLIDLHSRIPNHLTGHINIYVYTHWIIDVSCKSTPVWRSCGIRTRRRKIISPRCTRISWIRHRLATGSRPFPLCVRDVWKRSKERWRHRIPHCGSTSAIQRVTRVLIIAHAYSVDVTGIHESGFYTSTFIHVPQITHW